MPRPRKTLEQLKQTGTYQNHKGRYKDLEAEAEKFQRQNVKEFDHIKELLRPTADLLENDTVKKMAYVTLLKLFDNKILMATDAMLSAIAFMELDKAYSRIKELPNFITDTKRLLVELKMITAHTNAFKTLVKNFQIDGLKQNAPDYELREEESYAEYIDRVTKDRQKRQGEKEMTVIERILARNDQ